MGFDELRLSERDRIFLDLRPRLFGIAYRMLAVRQDAEDAVQDVYLRWCRSNIESVSSPEAWLVSITTRLCIDRLRSLKVEREAYSGPWLPEPVRSGGESPEGLLETAQHLSTAFMLVLERLTPDERACFLLHEVFDCEYEEIASILRKSAGACRQLCYKARQRLASDGARFTASALEHRDLVERFARAASDGDIGPIASLLGANTRLLADGGGKVAVVLRPLQGADRIARLFHVVRKQATAHGVALRYELSSFNGEACLARTFSGMLHSIISFGCDSARIRDVYVLANPDKLRAASGGMPLLAECPQAMSALPVPAARCLVPNP
jgi:RNA polymerase sigma-70 factor (ECF subfamily)